MRITLTAEERDLLAKAASFARLGASFDGPGEYGRYSRSLNIGALAELEEILKAEHAHPGARTFVFVEDLAAAAQNALFFAAQQIARYVEHPGALHPIRAQLLVQRFRSEPLIESSERLTDIAARFAERHRRVRPTVPSPNVGDDGRLLVTGPRRPTSRWY